MTIDLNTERVLPLSAVPEHLPKRNGKKVHYSTVYRWATKGARGRRLETVMCGGVRFTTVEAVHRFVGCQADRSSSPTSPIKHQ
jgi:hypothetical protein